MNVDYDTVQSACESLSVKIKKKKVDYIIGIGRGGLIPATILGYQLNKPIYNLGLSSYDDKKRTDNINEYQSGIDFTALNRKKTILIVDDLSDSGNSLHYAVEKYSWAVKRVYTATIFLKDKSEFKPDFYWDKVNSDTWIKFPWE